MNQLTVSDWQCFLWLWLKRRPEFPVFSRRYSDIWTKRLKSVLCRIFRARSTKWLPRKSDANSTKNCASYPQSARHGDGKCSEASVVEGLRPTHLNIFKLVFSRKITSPLFLPSSVCLVSTGALLLSSGRLCSVCEYFHWPRHRY